MFHRLLAGYFNYADVCSRKLIVLRPMDISLVMQLAEELGVRRTDEGYEFESDLMYLREGYVDFPWLTPGINDKAVQFMIRLNQITGCMFFELGHGEIVGVDVLLESIKSCKPMSEHNSTTDGDAGFS